MIITNQTSRCCNAPLLLSASNEGTSYYLCSKCNEATDAITEYKLPDIEITPDTKIFRYSEKQTEYDYIIKLQTRIAELENEVSNLRAKSV